MLKDKDENLVDSDEDLNFDVSDSDDGASSKPIIQAPKKDKSASETYQKVQLAVPCEERG